MQAVKKSFLATRFLRRREGFRMGPQRWVKISSLNKYQALPLCPFATLQLCLFKTVINKCMQQKELVSVIIPLYNRAGLIEETLDSVVHQTWRPIEIVVVDDGSTDDSVRVVQQWFKTLRNEQKKGLSVNLLKQANKGAPAARNHGLREAKGEYIQFLDSDDLLMPEKLAVHVRFLIEHPAYDYVYSMGRSFGSQTKNIITGNKKSKTVGGLLGKNPLNTETGVYTKRVCNKIGGWDEKLEVWQDREYNLRLLLLKPKIKFISKVLFLFRFHRTKRVSDDFTSSNILYSIWKMDEVLKTRRRDIDIENGENMLSAQCFSIALHALMDKKTVLAHDAIHLGLKLSQKRGRTCKLMVLNALLRLMMPAKMKQTAAWGIMQIIKLKR
jgi:glycosyltransferase involved in cell wall biosynthesis